MHLQNEQLEVHIFSNILSAKVNIVKMTIKNTNIYKLHFKPQRSKITKPDFLKMNKSKESSKDEQENLKILYSSFN